MSTLIYVNVDIRWDAMMNSAGRNVNAFRPVTSWQRKMMWMSLESTETDQHRGTARRRVPSHQRKRRTPRAARGSVQIWTPVARMRRP